MDMSESEKELINVQQVAEQVFRILMNYSVSIPEFPNGDVPISVAAKVYGKDASWVKAGIISGWLPIGRATRAGKLITDISEINSKYGRINYQISPKKLWEDTGYIWKGETS